MLFCINSLVFLISLCEKRQKQPENYLLSLNHTVNCTEILHLDVSCMHEITIQG